MGPAPPGSGLGPRSLPPLSLDAGRADAFTDPRLRNVSQTTNCLFLSVRGREQVGYVQIPSEAVHSHMEKVTMGELAHPGAGGRGANWLRAPVWVRDPALQGPCCVTSGTFLSLSVPLREAVRVEGVTADTRALPGVPVLLLTRPGTIHSPPSARIGRGSAQPRQERAAGPMKGSHHADWQGGGGRGRQT